MGERAVTSTAACPRCKRDGTLRRLRVNFKCADIICDFCGFLAQVKTKSVMDIDVLPSSVLGAAWGPMQERLEAGIYFPLYLVLVAGRRRSIWYLAADLQTRDMFRPRNPLGPKARRAGWQGFTYDFGQVTDAFVRVR